MIIVIFVIGFIFLFGVYLSEGIVERIAMGFLGALLGTLIGFLIGFIITEVGAECAKLNYTQTSETAIYAMEDNSTDNYFIHSYNNKNGLQYTYIVKDDDNAYIVKTVDSGNSKIYYSDKDYKIVCSEGIFDNWFLRFLTPWTIKEEYSFYIPEGSIKTDYYNVDLQ